MEGDRLATKEKEDVISRHSMEHSCRKEVRNYE